MPTLTFATGNEHKLAEARTQLEPLGYELTQHAGGYPELQAEDLQTVARHGLDHLAGQLEEPFLLEDAGLFVDALEGFPGVYSSYAFATIGNEGILRLLEGIEDRSARFRSVIGLREEGETHLFVGEVEGRIVHEVRGEEGFGFDPIFQPLERSSTFAQMPREAKTKLSHRARALEELRSHLEARPAP